MDLRKIVKWLVLLLIVVIAWQEGGPRLKKLLADASPSAVSSDVAGETLDNRCIRLATETAQDFGAGVSKYGRDRSDTGGWMRFAGRIQKRVESARNYCACPSDACSKASSALVQLGGLVQKTDGMVRGSTEEMFNPATDMEEIYDKLDQAKSLARSSSKSRSEDHSEDPSEE